MSNTEIKPPLRQTDVIASAIALVKPIADKYEPKQRPMWFEYRTKDGYRISFDGDQSTYCEDCVNERKEEIEKWDKKELPEDFDCLICSEETSREGSDFTHCESCGEIIECGILWTEQEMTHWTALKSEDWEQMKDSPYSNYEILKILEDDWCEYEKEKQVIAECVLKHWL